MAYYYSTLASDTCLTPNTLGDYIILGVGVNTEVTTAYVTLQNSPSINNVYLGVSLLNICYECSFLRNSNEKYYYENYSFSVLLEDYFSSATLEEKEIYIGFEMMNTDHSGGTGGSGQ